MRSLKLKPEKLESRYLDSYKTFSGGCGREPKVAPAAQPWAECWNPVGIQERDGGPSVSFDQPGDVFLVDHPGEIGGAFTFLIKEPLVCTTCQQESDKIFSASHGCTHEWCHAILVSLRIGIGPHVQQRDHSSLGVSIHCPPEGRKAGVNLGIGIAAEPSKQCQCCHVSFARCIIKKLLHRVTFAQ